MAQAQKPDLILMNMNMPELDGWEATRRLKETTETKDIPVIGLTAYAMSGDRERALQAGCTDYHAKPLEFDKLITQIETLLYQRSAAHQTPRDDSTSEICDL
jgi:CheY-like chemotaxis protein